MLDLSCTGNLNNVMVEHDRSVRFDSIVIGLMCQHPKLLYHRDGWMLFSDIHPYIGVCNSPNCKILAWQNSRMRETWASNSGGKEMTLIALFIDVGIVSSKPNGGCATRVQTLEASQFLELQQSRQMRALDIVER